jgi:hypothetical protein
MSPPPGVAKARKLLFDYVKSWESGSRPSATPQYWDQTARHIAAQIKPEVYEYIISHDRDDKLRTASMSNFGDLISPQRTLSTFIRVARTNPAWSVRSMATAMIYINFAGGLLGGPRKDLEQFALDSISDPHREYFAIKILGYCRTARADAMLRKVVVGNYSEIDKRNAQSGLDGKYHIGDEHNRPQLNNSHEKQRRA